ncbi:MAG: SDR family NAD(P)-dependent oxidoreductase [Gammaproteobacteria bacterium]
MKLQHRFALVTGGTRGIGLGIVDALLAEGASVTMMGRDAQTAVRVMAQRNGHERLAFVTGDVLRPGAVEAAIDATVARWGRVDILVNNAGGNNHFIPLVEHTEQTWYETLDWNVTSVFRAMRHVIPIMKRQGGGRIVNISSMRSKKQAANQGPYGAAKAALNALTKSTALEVGDFNITVNAICVGVVLTDLAREGGRMFAATQGITADEMFARYAREQMASRTLQTPEIMAALTVLLCSDEGHCISGVAWSADGGLADY